MRNFVSEGLRISLVFAATAKGGDLVVQGALAGVAQGDTASGELGVIVPKGIFELPKAGGETWGSGDAIYWDATAQKCTTDDTDNRLIGAAVLAATEAATLGQVLLDGVIRPPLSGE